MLGWRVERMHVVDIIFVIILLVFTRQRVPTPLFRSSAPCCSVGKHVSRSSRVFPSPLKMRTLSIPLLCETKQKLYEKNRPRGKIPQGRLLFVYLSYTQIQRRILVYDILAFPVIYHTRRDFRLPYYVGRRGFRSATCRHYRNIQFPVATIFHLPARSCSNRIRIHARLSHIRRFYENYQNCRRFFFVIGQRNVCGVVKIRIV